MERKKNEMTSRLRTIVTTALAGMASTLIAVAPASAEVGPADTASLVVAETSARDILTLDSIPPFTWTGACQWQYDNVNARAAFSDENNAYSWYCFDDTDER